ncbi:MAG: transglycosylase SLT domain-containing protein [Planctomycetota bacterium]|nr:transglycosylase SLT domain-containing protein [Planctomycetota bacterium]MEC8512133.1 transglycosylase SLT domain-containing protein [Planctomycetota bacterium]MEE2940922.1 transglycosylase SLT domain-containing protein [Planctomycetota bacterium]
MRRRRDTFMGLVLAGFAAVVLPGLMAVALEGRAVLASAPGRVFGAILRGPLDAGALDRIDGLREVVEAAAEAAGVEPALVAGVIFAESRGVGGRRSSAGALGLMQLIPAAGRDAGRRAGIEVPESDEELEAALLEDDELNVRLGAAHLRWLIDHRGDWDDEAVLVSYNAGRARLFGWIERDGGYEAWVRGEEARARRGERTTGALAYARQVQRVRDRFRARWRP